MKKHHGGHKSHKHTGPIHHKGVMHVTSHPGKDPMIHESHHAANAEHDMHDGYSPAEGYEEGPGHENEECCD